MSKTATRKILRELDPENVTPDELIDCFKDHVRGGFALNGNFELARRLIRGVGFNKDEKKIMRGLAQEGVVAQDAKKNEGAARNYRSIIRVLRER